MNQRNFRYSDADQMNRDFEMNDDYPDRFSRVGPDGYQTFDETNGEQFGMSYRDPLRSREEYLNDAPLGRSLNREDYSNQRFSDQENRYGSNRESFDGRHSRGRFESSYPNRNEGGNRMSGQYSNQYGNGRNGNDYYRSDNSSNGWQSNGNQNRGQFTNRYSGEQQVNRGYGRMYGNEGYDLESRRGQGSTNSTGFTSQYSTPSSSSQGSNYQSRNYSSDSYQSGSNPNRESQNWGSQGNDRWSNQGGMNQGRSQQYGRNYGQGNNQSLGNLDNQGRNFESTSSNYSGFNYGNQGYGSQGQQSWQQGGQNQNWQQGRSNQGQSGQYSGKGPKNYQRNDDRIREDVCEMLTQHGSIDASEIEVQVSNGEVTLSGSVSSRQEKRMAEEAIENLGGIKDVNNQLKVIQQSAQQSTSSRSGSSSSDQSSEGRSATSTNGSTNGSSNGSSASSQTDSKKKANASSIS